MRLLLATHVAGVMAIADVLQDSEQHRPDRHQWPSKIRPRNS
jgi:hypothetical protein